RALISTIFPYTTLFRSPTWLQEYIHKPVEKASEIEIVDDDYVPFEDTVVEEILEEEMTPLEEEPVEHEENEASLETLMHEAIGRSEEHTSELQSRENLV